MQIAGTVQHTIQTIHYLVAMKPKSIIKRLLQITSLAAVIVLLMLQYNVIWRSPDFYRPKELKALVPPVMSMDEYTTSGLIDTHARPYVFTITNRHTKGAVLVFGAGHTKDPGDKQFQQMKDAWGQFGPTIALVEGRLGFLFSWIQDPVKTLGEGGLTARLARKKGIPLYSWEPERDRETDMLLQQFDPYHLAAFYCLRPYRGNYSGLSTAASNEVMAGLIGERTNRKGIKGYIHSVQQIDSIWKSDHPDAGDWRTYKHPQNGWPVGTFALIAQESNAIRDVFMCNTIIELVNRGERVFITMGSSHAPRIEKTLAANLTGTAAGK